MHASYYGKLKLKPKLLNLGRKEIKIMQLKVEQLQSIQCLNNVTFLKIYIA